MSSPYKVKVYFHTANLPEQEPDEDAWMDYEPPEPEPADDADYADVANSYERGLGLR